VTTGRDLEPDTLVVDVGGGSTELVVGGPDGVARHWSLDVGCVRMTERFGNDLDGCASAVRAALPDLGAARAIGVAGTVTTLATLDLGLAEYDPERVHGHPVTRASLDAQLARLASLSLEARRRVPGLEPDRAPVIVAGLVVLREVLAAAGLDSIEASERDLLHGAALEAAAVPMPVEGDAPPGAYTCC
jgi:exopolyphosphatase/guanosine-5'-triphosphate,3'-diphosphate pyrophosphatase